MAGPQPAGGGSPPATGQWWVVSYNPIGEKFTYHYLQGTREQADTLASEAVDGSVTGPFTTEAAAKAAVKAGHVTPPTTTQPHIPNPLGAVAPWAAGLSGFLHDLTERSTWFRVLKIVIGGTLIIVGALHINQVRDLAGTAAKAAVLA